MGFPDQTQFAAELHVPFYTNLIWMIPVTGRSDKYRGRICQMEQNSQIELFRPGLRFHSSADSFTWQ
jgi:hypothetical protein